MSWSNLLSGVGTSRRSSPLSTEDNDPPMPLKTLKTPQTNSKRKRGRRSSEDGGTNDVDDEEDVGSKTPVLMPRADSPTPGDCHEREAKRQRRDGPPHPSSVESPCAAAGADTSKAGRGDTSEQQNQSALLRLVPDEVVGHVLSYVGGTEDRFAVQATCSTFRRLSDADEILSGLYLGGDVETGRMGILTPRDTPATAMARLQKFVGAGSLEATYMLGMIYSYCNENVSLGIYLLEQASLRGYVRSSYALGLILRDTLRDESDKYLRLAASRGYFPANQELLSAREMKARFGEPTAEELRRYLDPVCLNRLLARHYLHCTEVRCVQTSHCWNPLCGRWAFKTGAGGLSIDPRTRVHVEAGLDGNDDRTGDDPLSAFPRSPAALRGALAGRGVARAMGASFPSAFPLSRIGRTDATAAAAGGAPGAGSARASSSASSSSGGEADAPSAAPPAALDYSIAIRSVEKGGGTNNSNNNGNGGGMRVSRMKMCSSCRRAKYCSKLCQVYDWRSNRHKMECQYLG